MKPNKLLTLFLSLTIAFVVLTGSIAVPILFRPFYYAQIGPLHLAEQTGWSVEQIKLAYDEVLDFCLFGGDFRVGGLLWSEAGKSHFEDAAALFHLDFWILGIAAVLMIVCLLGAHKHKLTLWKPLGRGPRFWGGAGPLAVFGAIGAVAATNFSAAFVVFHQLFFPGKDNWILDYQTDEIILILPEAYFRNCAILFLVLLVGTCVVLMVSDFSLRKK